MGEALGGYFTGTRAIGSPVSDIPNPFGESGIAVAQSSLASRPSILDGTMIFNGTSSFLRSLAPITGSLPTIAAQRVPDGAGEDPGRGFTCTGLAIDTAGNLWIGNDGRRRGGSTFVASVVKTDPTGASKLAEYRLGADLGLPTDSSVQGVAFVPASATGGVGEVWFVRTAGATRQVHRIDADTGALLPDPWGGATFPALNGLAYDSNLDALIVGDNTSTIRWFARTASSTATPVRTMVLSTTPDQLHFDAVRKWIWFTGGPNGVDGFLRGRDASGVPQADHVQMTLAQCQSVEGLVVTATGIIVTNDAWFHDAAPVLENQLRFCPLPANLPAASPAYATTDRVQLFGIARAPTTPTQARCLIAIGGVDPTVSSQPGVGFHVGSSAGRLNAFQNGAFTAWNGLTLSSEFLFYCDIDLLADTAELWFNGVSQGSVPFSASPAAAMQSRGPFFSIGNHVGSNQRFFAGEIRAIGHSLGAAGALERQRIEGFMAHDVGRSALLPAAHPFSSAPP